MLRGYEIARARPEDLSLLPVIEFAAAQLLRGHAPESVLNEATDGVSEQTMYAWRRQFGVLEAADVKRLRALEAENSRLKKLFAEHGWLRRPRS